MWVRGEGEQKRIRRGRREEASEEREEASGREEGANLIGGGGIERGDSWVGYGHRRRGKREIRSRGTGGLKNKIIKKIKTKSKSKL